MRHLTLGISILFNLIFLTSCNNDDSSITSEEATLRINHYEVVGFGPFLGLYNLIQEEDKFNTNEWSIFYNGISGLNYELGYTYEVNVLITKIDNPPADSPAYKYELKDLISKEKVSQNTEFEIKLKQALSTISDTYLTGTLDEGFRIANQVNIDCGEICEQLEEVQDTNQVEDVTGVFKHSNQSNTIELIRIEKK